MSELTEKLGIKPILMYEGGGGYYVDGEQVRKLEQQNADMLEVLIDLVTDALSTRQQTHGGFRGGPERYYSGDIKVIEKVTDKSWQEIKQVIEE